MVGFDNIHGDPEPEPYCPGCEESQETIDQLVVALEEIFNMKKFAETMNEYGMIHQAGDIAEAAINRSK